MRNLLEVVLSINISSLRDEEAAPGKLCQKNKKLRTCYTEDSEKMALFEVGLRVMKWRPIISRQEGSEGSLCIEY